MSKFLTKNIFKKNNLLTNHHESLSECVALTHVYFWQLNPSSGSHAEGLTTFFLNLLYLHTLLSVDV